MAEPTCHYCERPAEQECPTCGRLYCSMHGDNVCLRCMAPESAAPSATVYRGSLLALVAGTLVMLFLVVRPPASSGAGDTVRLLPTATRAIGATATPTPQGGAAQQTPPPAATSATTPSASVTTTPAAGQPRSHTVASGDTLSGIAARYGVDVASIVELNPGLTADSTLEVGSVLQIPPAS